MRKPDTAVQESDKTIRRRRRTVVAIVIGTVLITVVGFSLVGLWVVARFFAEPEAVFVASPRKIVIPPKTREHKMQMAKHQAMAPKPSMQKQLVSSRPTPLSLPDLPTVDLNQMLPLDPAELVSDQVTSLVGSAGLGSGTGSGLTGMGGSGTGLSFFGVEVAGERIVLLFDVSKSVVNGAEETGVPMARIKEETLRLINGLPINARFSVIQFVRNFKPFQPELVVANKANKDLAKAWVEEEWGESGQMARGGKGVISLNPNGLVCVLDAAFAMKPELIFLISDGNFYQTYPNDGKISYDVLGDKIEEWEKKNGGKIPLHFLGFAMDEDDEDAWKKLTRRTGGTFKLLRIEDKKAEER